MGGKMIDANVKIFILGLRDRFRGKDLFELFNKQDYNVEIFWGYSKSDIDVLGKFSYPEKSEFLYGRNISWSEIACSVGHRKILEKAVAENANCLVVLEDDVMINDLNWLNAQIEESIESAEAELRLLLADSRLCLTRKSFSRKATDGKKSKIFSNPSPTAAYIYNKEALQRIIDLPESLWYGVQADFPPALSKVVTFVDASSQIEPIPIALVQVESSISDRQEEYRNTLKFRLWYFHKVSLLGYFRGRKYDLDLKTYIYHFVNRPIAWKLSRERMPTQGIKSPE